MTRIDPVIERIASITGAWIETPFVNGSASALLSRPSRARGLKLTSLILREWSVYRVHHGRVD